MYLIDQKGDQIKAVYYYGNTIRLGADQIAEGISEGRVYSIEGGEVKKCKISSNLEIVLDNNSKIEQYKDIFIFPFSMKKLTKFQNLKQSSGTGNINLIGVLKCFEIVPPNESTYKPKAKIKGTIFNPIQNIEVQFSKCMMSGESQPIIGGVYVFNSFLLLEADYSIRLIGSGNSYLVRVSEEDQQFSTAPTYPQSQYLQKLHNLLANPAPHPQNLSQIPYTKRTISQLLSLSTQTETALYSQLLTSILDIKLKKQYMACSICRRGTIQQQQTYILYQCLKCKKIVDPVPTLIVKIVLADSTASIEMDVIGRNVQVFIGVGVAEFLGFGQEERECALQICRFSQFVVKLKSQRKAYELIHYVQEVDKQQTILTMKQIRRRTVQQKLKLQQKWQTPI